MHRHAPFSHSHRRMRQIAILLTLFLTVKAGATHWLTYYVYVERAYVQGPWARTNLLNGSGYRYLAPEVHEDLFGTIRDELVEKMLTRLQEDKPELYDWNYNMQIKGDTVYLEPGGSFVLNETIMNEVTATMTINSFAAVCFRFPGGEEVYTLEDLTLPYFDLVSSVSGDPPEVSEEPAQPNGNNTTTNPLVVWLILSVLTNLALLLFLIFKSRK